MYITHSKEIVPQQGRIAQVQAIAWSPDSSRLAVCNAENAILLFDEVGERRDKFMTKSIDAETNRTGYAIKGLCFSADSTKLAVGQTDCAVFVYKLGKQWTDKKVICNKFVHKGPVMCLIWIAEHGIIAGTLEGRVRLANPRTNKTSTVYNTEVMVTALASCHDGDKFVSGHSDGSIVIYSFGTSAAKKFCSHPVAPNLLLWSLNTLVAAGCDKRVLIYDSSGALFQQLVHGNEPEVREVCSAAASPGGQTIALGSYDKFQTYTWSNKKSGWVEAETIRIKNMYIVKPLCWKSDGSKIAVGGSSGAVELFDCCLKQMMLSKNFEVSYTGHNQILIRSRVGPERMALRSRYGEEISDVAVLGKDRFVVAKSKNSLLLGDFLTGKSSEIAWQSAGNERYYFEFENVSFRIGNRKAMMRKTFQCCLIFNAGELTVVEFGVDEPLLSLKISSINPHLISVRIRERLTKDCGNVKYIAYAVEQKMIMIVNLTTGNNEQQIKHDYSIDWLELNETAKFLLWRDKKHKLYEYDIEKKSEHVLLSHCNFVQWVPGSDVIVAQSDANLCVWYDIRGNNEPTIIPIQGDVVQIIRQDRKTEVIVENGSETNAYLLDENMVEFQTALEDKNFKRALNYLTTLRSTSTDSTSMWRQLANAAIEAGNLVIAERCFAILCDIPRLRYVKETRRIAAQSATNETESRLNSCEVRARLALMRRDFEEVVQIYSNENMIDKAVEMFISLHKWEFAIDIAKKHNYANLEALKSRYMGYLLESQQLDLAAEVNEKQGNYANAVELYLKANLPYRATNVLVKNSVLLSETELVESVSKHLLDAECYEQAAMLYEKTKDYQRSFELYRKVKAFDKAIALGRTHFPENVVKLEEEWGDYLCSIGQVNAAVSHYIESGQTVKALDAAIRSEQWAKALEISQVLENSPENADKFCQIADHLASNGEFNLAEKLYTEAGVSIRSAHMYIAAKLWDDAYRVALKCLTDDEVNDMFLEEAAKLESAGLLRDAEKLYCAIQQPNRAIAMYKKANQYDSMMRLIKQHHPDHVKSAYLHIGKEMEEDERYKEAENYYVLAEAWKSAVRMHRAAGKWEDAYRVAKEQGGDDAAIHVIYLWAEALRGESAIKLLVKFDCIEQIVEMACGQADFDFAEEICRIGMKSKLNYVHLKHGLKFEEEENLEMAEAEFLKGENPKEAVLMYVQRQDWDNAKRIAEKHCPEEMSEIYIGQARLAFQQREYLKGESYLLRAEQPELLIKTYKELNLWAEALRICREYLPSQLSALQDEYELMQLSTGPKGAPSFLAQGNKWEKQGEHERAVMCYLKITPEISTDENLMEKCWLRAADIVKKFLDYNPTLLRQIAGSLESINRHKQAAELFLECDETKEAVDCLINGDLFDEASHITSQMAPELKLYVEQRYKEYLKQQGRADLLAEVDLASALEIVESQGEWKKALEIARQHNDTELVQKYALLLVNQLCENGNYLEAVENLNQCNLPLTPEVRKTAKQLTTTILSQHLELNATTYRIYANLRNYLNGFVKQLVHIQSSPDEMNFFKRCLRATHYQANRTAFAMNDSDNEIQLMSMKLTFSLLRYSDILPVDKAFYDAGMAAQKVGRQYRNAAFVFLNHFLDIRDAIEESDADLVDYSDFEKTDIPANVPLPKEMTVDSVRQEEAKEWVLAASVDKEVKRELPLDERGVYEACLLNSDNSTAEECILTGYPILGSKRAFANTSFVANKNDWSKALLFAKVSNSLEMEDVIKFVENWT